MTSNRPETVTKFIEAPRFVARLEVPVVYVEDEPDAPMLEAKTLKFLAEARQHAAANDRAWLLEHGAKLFVSIDEVTPRPTRVA